MGREQGAATRLWVRILVLWTIGAAILIAEINTEEAAPLGWLTLGLVSLFSLGGPLKVARIAGAIVALGLFAASQIYPMWDPSRLQELITPLASTLLAVTCISVAGLLSHIVGSQLTCPSAQPASDSPAAPQTVQASPAPQQTAPAHAGPQREPSADETAQNRLLSALGKVLAGWEPRSNSYGKSSVDLADELLAREIARSSRYGRVFSLALFEVRSSSQRDGGGDHLARQMEDVVVRQLRTVDSAVSIGANRIAVILPETPKGGAIIMAERVHKLVAAACSTECRVGIAEYPSDADNKTELVEEAEAALDVARLADIPVAGRQAVG
jgi:GGDEF domain-containing protein